MQTPGRLASEIAGRSDVLDTIAEVFSRYVSPDRRSSSASPSRAHSARSRTPSPSPRWRRASPDSEPVHSAPRRKESGGGLRGQSQFHGAPADVFDRVRYLEIRSREAEQAYHREHAAFEDAHTKLRETLSVLEEKAVRQQELAEENESLKERLQHCELDRDAYSRRLQHLTVDHERHDQEKDRLLANQRDRLAAAETRIVELERDREHWRDADRSKATNATRLQRELAEAREETDRLRQQLDAISADAQAETMLRAQVRHLRIDNARLVKLLASTAEYRDFVASTFAKDPNARGGCLASSYLPRVPEPDSALAPDFLGGGDVEEKGEASARWGDIEGYEREYATEMQHDDTDLNPRKESQRWVPTPSLRAAIQARQEGGPLEAVSTTRVRDLLRRMHGMWRRRFVRQIQLVKEKMRRQITETERSCRQRTPYREILQASTIARLQAELDNVRRASEGRMVAVGGSKKASRSNSPLLRLLAGDRHVQGKKRRSSIGGTSLRPRRKQPRSGSNSKRRRRASIHGWATTEMTTKKEKKKKAEEEDVDVDKKAGMGPSKWGDDDGDDAFPRKGYGWAPQWAWRFPAAANGGGGHAKPWKPAREHAQLMDRSLATVESLAKDVERLQRERDGLAEALHEAFAEKIVPFAAANAARKAALLRGITWLGQKMLVAMDNAEHAIRSHGTVLRTSASSVDASGGPSETSSSERPAMHAGMSYAAVDSQVAAMEREVSSLRLACRAAFERGLEAKHSMAVLRSIIQETHGAMGDEADDLRLESFCRGGQRPQQENGDAEEEEDEDELEDPLLLENGKMADGQHSRHTVASGIARWRESGATHDWA